MPVEPSNRCPNVCCRVIIKQPFSVQGQSRSFCGVSSRRVTGIVVNETFYDASDLRGVLDFVLQWASYSNSDAFGSQRRVDYGG